MRKVATAGGESFDREFAACRPGQGDGREHVALALPLCRKAVVGDAGLGTLGVIPVSSLKPVPGVPRVIRGAETEAMFARNLRPAANNIPLRAGADRVPLMMRRVVAVEIIVMIGQSEGGHPGNHGRPEARPAIRQARPGTSLLRRIRSGGLFAPAPRQKVIFMASCKCRRSYVDPVQP